MGKVFISHAASDQALVNAFVERLILLGSGVPAEQVFYSSDAATGVPPGFDFVDYIREQAAEASIVVAVVTPKFLASTFCMNEVGAAWVLAQDFFPIAVPALDLSSLEGVLPGRQVPRMDDPGALDLLHKRICAALGRTPDPVAWGPRKKQFESKLPTLLRGLTAPDFVPRAELADARQRITELEEALGIAEEERHALRARPATITPADPEVQIKAAVFGRRALSSAPLRRAHTEATDAWLRHSSTSFVETDLTGAEAVILVPAAPLEAIRRLVHVAQRELQRHYSAFDPTEPRYFKANFMTLSYIDGGITIAAWANPDDRQPRSLARRPGNPDLYANTKTAAVYGMLEPHELIIDDTRRPEHRDNYNLDPDQRDRIRSHIVWPVLSPTYELLGTLVFDCNEAGFFLPDDHDLWKAYCEAFARPLAVEKMRLDFAVLRNASEHFGPGPANWPEPPF